MATRLKEVDAVVIGMGWAGAIMARELTLAGLTLSGLERGPDRRPAEDFALPGIRDELKYQQRLELMGDNSIDTITFRNRPDQLALPIRRWSAFLPGEGVGGTGNHWGGAHWRFQPDDFHLRSYLEGALWRQSHSRDDDDPGLARQLWRARAPLRPLRQGVRRFRQGGKYQGPQDRTAAMSFEGPRSSEYPNRPMPASEGGLMFAAAAKSLGYHPFPVPFSAASAPYKNIYGVYHGRLPGVRLLHPHRLRGQRQGVLGHHHHAGAAPGAEIRAAHAGLCLQADLRQARRSASPACSTPTSRPAWNTSSRPISWCFRLSSSPTPTCCFIPGSGSPMIMQPAKGQVGRNYCYQFEAPAVAFFPDKELNPYMGSPGGGVVIDDFNNASFDHSGLGFCRGRLFRRLQRRHPANRRARRCRRVRPPGAAMEARNRQMVLSRRPLQHPGLGLCPSRQLYGHRSDLPGCAGTAAIAR